MGDMDKADSAKSTSITEQLDPGVLAAANNLWAAALMQKGNVKQLLAVKKVEDLVKINAWLQQSDSERETDPGFVSMRTRVRGGLEGMAEAVLKSSEFLIAQAMRKELSSSAEQRISQLSHIVATELSLLAEQSVDEILSPDPSVFLKEEGGHLSDRVIERSRQILWNKAALFMEGHMLNKPAIDLVKSTYAQLLSNFMRGYEVHMEMKARVESRGK